nr:immunoglobulin heavy chain junction region [Mus musculus]MBK4187753.1 immunoglobulin heavy chain junction region [Mus musculus]MBK4187754.1 immunoglobulin heavy chain junction region [Mus musculus]MBK4187755.1 immunoglobulin heavy chain junction region [Mus musculus]MBK4187756.1 immunoglobulin heavy chain junction region [Mus musculus]
CAREELGRDAMDYW